MRRMFLALLVAGLMLTATAVPALAHIHGTIPAGDCAAEQNAANKSQGFDENNPVQERPAGPPNAQDVNFPVNPATIPAPDTPPAPDTCPADR